MKTFNRTSLPDVIVYNGDEYFRNSKISHAMAANNTNPNVIHDTLKKEGRKGVLVKVMHRNLRHKIDLHGKPYQPTNWIYTNDKQFELTCKGESLFIGSENECYFKLQRVQSQSADWAIKYEGYKIEPVESTKDI